jgi:Histidine kinase-, DNA gyrase B-, and HSP90-like ATPase/Response regulator receiver domain
MTDRLQLKQVILNLGRNAAKFVEHGFVRLRADVINGCVFLFIGDLGPGIPEEKRKNLFCKFQESLDVLNQGTGIGLSLCKRLVTLMGGEIRLDESYLSGVDNHPGACCVVSLYTLPLVVECVDISNRSFNDKRSDESLPQALDILFVDDDMVLRKLFSRSIRKLNPNGVITEASSGESALQLAASHTYDIILMDQYMTSAEKIFTWNRNCAFAAN